jgi:hypothetical protein
MMVRGAEGGEGTQGAGLKCPSPTLNALLSEFAVRGFPFCPDMLRMYSGALMLRSTWD